MGQTSQTVVIRKPDHELLHAVQDAADGKGPNIQHIARAILQIHRQCEDLTAAMQELTSKATFTRK
jgi:hypothetical protein